MLKNKQTLIINNSIELGENISDEAKGKGRKFTSRFIEPGIAHYEQFGDVLITKETLNSFIQTMIGCPVIIKHKDIDDTNADKERVGVVSNVWFDEYSGWYCCDGIIWDKQAIDLVKNQDWNVSCTYDFESDKKPIMHNGKKVDMEFVGGEFLHLALVPNPRYERANIVLNSKDLEEQQTENGGEGSGDFGHIGNSPNVGGSQPVEERKVTESQKIDKNKDNKSDEEKKSEFDEILQRICKQQSDVENSLEDKKGNTIMTVLDDLKSFILSTVNNEVKEEEKKEAVDADENEKIEEKIEKDEKEAENKCKNEEEKEEKFEEEKEIADNKCKNEEEKEEEIKEEVKNSMDEVKDLVMGGNKKVQNKYVSRADRFALGENY